MWRAIYQAVITPGLQPSEVADQAVRALNDVMPGLGLARTELRDEIDEMIRNAYREGWREAKQRSDEDPPLLEVDWTQPGGVRINELWTAR